MIALTFEELERQVENLPPQKQLQLLARVSEKLSIGVLPFTPEKGDVEKSAHQKQLTPINAWLAECDRVAELWEGTFDAAADLRRLRDEE